MGQHRMGPPEDLVLALQRRLNLGSFVETGTYRGDTAAWAADHFPGVITVELSTAYHAAALQRFRDRKNVRPLGGDSKQLLADLADELTAPAMFWLDAHWSGLDTAGSESECPLLGEIASINAATPDHVILVDDARLFAAPPPRPHRAEQWPDLATVVNALSDGPRRHVALFEDVLIAVPAADRDFLRNFLQEAITAAVGQGRIKQWWRKKSG